MKKLIILALLAMLMLSIASASLSSYDKSAIEEKAEKLLTNFEYVAYADAEVTPEDNLLIFIIPTGGSTEEDLGAFMGNMGAVTAIYTGSCKNWPDLQNLVYQIGYEKNKPSVEMYGLRSWVDDVREDASGYDDEDLKTLSNKIYYTIKEV